MKKILIFSITIFTILTILGARAHSLWTDEAETALFARTINEIGLPKGWDGTNLIGINEGIVLNQNLIDRHSPWPPHYLVAISFRLFGEGNFTARLPFIIFSLFSLLSLYNLTLRLTKEPFTATFTVILTSFSIPFILFSYQARYYPLTIFFGLLLAGSALRLVEKNIFPKLLFIFSGILFIYSHYVSFAAFSLALLVSCFVYLHMEKGISVARKFVLWYLLLSIPILVTFLPWFLWLNPPGNRLQIILPKVSELFLSLPLFISKVARSINQTGWLPVLLLPFIFLALKMKKTHLKAALAFLSILIVLYFLLMIGATLISRMGREFFPFYAPRYTTAAAPFLIMTASILLAELWQLHRLAGTVVSILYLFTTTLSLTSPRSFFLDYFGEITRSYPSPEKTVADYLTIHAKEGDTAFVSLDRSHEPLIFYLKDKIRFVNRISRFNRLVYPANRANLAEYVYNFHGAPDWIILFGKRPFDLALLSSQETFDFRDYHNLGLSDLTNYEEEVLPIYFADLSRPEIEFHQFKKVEPTYEDQIFIYKHKK